MALIKLSTSNTELIKEVISSKYVTKNVYYTVSDHIQYDGTLIINSLDDLYTILDMIEIYITFNKPSNVGDFEMLSNTIRQYENSFE